MATREIFNANGQYAGYARLGANGNVTEIVSREVNNAIRTAAMRAAARERRGGTTRIVTRRRA